jgi:hypothetical protein
VGLSRAFARLAIKNRKARRKEGLWPIVGVQSVRAINLNGCLERLEGVDLYLWLVQIQGCEDKSCWVNLTSITYQADLERIMPPLQHHLGDLPLASDYATAALGCADA